MSPGRLHCGDPRQSGGIGRHATFRALCAYARGGSSPPFGTYCLGAIRKGRIVGLVRRFAKPLSGSTFLDQPPQAAGIVQRGTPRGDAYVTPARMRSDQHKEVGRSLPNIFVVPALHAAGSGRLSSHLIISYHIISSYHIIKQTQGIGRSGIDVGVKREHILHRRDKGGAHGGNTPGFVLPGLQRVFLSKARMVSGEMRSTKPSSIALPAKRRSVQWSWPAGASLHATAMRWACCSPVKAARSRSAAGRRAPPRHPLRQSVGARARPYSG